MRDILDLVLTIFVLLLVWVVPRLALESRKRKQRAAQKDGKKGSKKAPARDVPGAVNAGVVPAPDQEFYDWDEKAAESWLERQRAAEEPSLPVRPAAFGAPEETGMATPDYYSREEDPAGRLPAGRIRRRVLRRAVIWKEILDPPKALHPNPFR